MYPPGMLRALILATVLLALLPCAARAETLADALKRQEALSTLVEKWLSLASRDEGEDKVDEYSKYGEADWKKPKRNVKAEDLVQIMADKELDNDGLRMRAAKVLEEAAVVSRDPDLAPDKRGDIARRKTWAKKHLLPLIIKGDDEGGDKLGRKLAFDLLKAWFQRSPNMRDESDIFNYDPASAKEATWRPAHKVFREVLNR